MAFLEQPRFPERISFHGIGGPGYSTTAVIVNSGAEYRTGAWSQGLCGFEVSHAAKLPTQQSELVSFFRIAKGKLNGFRYKDWADFTVSSTEGVFGAIDSTHCQLYKRYTLGTVYVGTSTSSLAIAVASKTFTTQAGLSFVVGGRVRAFSNANSANFMEGPVTSYSSTTLVVAVDTIGGSGTHADWTLTAGTEDRKIVKPVRNISIAGGSGISVDYTTGIVTFSGAPTSWSGEFDVPCRFDIDQLKGEIIDRSKGQLLISYQSIPIVELRNP